SGRRTIPLPPGMESVPEPPPDERSDPYPTYGGARRPSGRYVTRARERLLVSAICRCRASRREVTTTRSAASGRRVRFILGPRVLGARRGEERETPHPSRSRR